MDSELVLELPSDVRGIEAAVDHVLRRCSECRTHARRLRLNLRVSLTEALSNAMLYGNASDPAKRVRVEVRLSAVAITARVIDEGGGFDPRTVPDPTTPQNICRAGGRGLFLMRELMDEVHYNDRGNCVTLVLRLDQFGEAASA
ncbi:MAG: ATP-binding protein [Gemmatimonadetes bacterium]|nr:ATP-binding protein [Gemmatimonadota bacterium]MBT8404330.1 ATP-binding protein [Gemmatimonadota bacterium]NNF37354.1 ATP-binding protein [Gemmatimonadota bacterium]NNK63297.1 ATP-binding protein [Gemmatimonadota bacterium]